MKELQMLWISKYIITKYKHTIQRYIIDTKNNKSEKTNNEKKEDLNQKLKEKLAQIRQDTSPEDEEEDEEVSDDYWD